MKKLIRKILITLFISGFCICMFITMVGITTQYQILDHIDYQVSLQEDGSMKVTETWNMEIGQTNTLVRNFNISSKFGEIKDVTIKDLDTNQYFQQIDRQMYHVTNNCFYALPINEKTFEIAWGVGMDNALLGKRNFQISYTITDVVKEYIDCQEFYWQFLARGQNAVPAKKVTGTITLPQPVSNIENLRVWGHGQFNGVIEKKDNQTVQFRMDNLEPEQMLEVRIVTQEKMFQVNPSQITYQSQLNTILQEETRWVKEADELTRTAWIQETMKYFIYTVVILYIVYKIIKYRKINKQKNAQIEYHPLPYYREIPREDATPTEACYLYKYDKERIGTQKIQSQAISATIMDLCLKRIISLRADNQQIYIRFLKEPETLQEDEKQVYQLLKNASNGKDEFPMEDINHYAKVYYYNYSNIVNQIVNHARNRLYQLKLVDRTNEYLYAKCKRATIWRNIATYGYGVLICMYISTFIPLFHTSILFKFGLDFPISALIGLALILPIILLFYYYKTLQDKAGGKIAVLTQQGADEQEKWKALARYMEEYSLLNEKEVPALVLWEKYLVYATAFGIADKAIEQMKASYPEVFIRENWDEEKIATEYPVIYFTTNSWYRYGATASIISRMNTDVQSAYDTSRAQITAHSSSSSRSGSGGGGGFSGGGGGRRRWWWNGRKIILLSTYYKNCILIIQFFKLQKCKVYATLFDGKTN